MASYLFGCKFCVWQVLRVANGEWQNGAWTQRESFRVFLQFLEFANFSLRKLIRQFSS